MPGSSRSRSKSRSRSRSRSKSRSRSRPRSRGRRVQRRPLRSLRSEYNKAYADKTGTYRTPGGLTRKDLMPNKDGKIVSKRKHAAGLKLQRKYGKQNEAALKKQRYKRKRPRSRSGTKSRRRSTPRKKRASSRKKRAGSRSRR